ncbi:hypothetical protein Golob_003806 [Gossypium lobatum]|uniref:Uncharacterized protein n=1 Tax=Gossypium lobatum TaxID=34289 RepID=A0A7J8MZG8_9ROSI|nr:hypothetical protein [Gossypium lobatum]
MSFLMKIGFNLVSKDNTLWLSDDVINLIVSIPPPHLESRLDRVFWAHSASGSFSMHSAYRSLKEGTWSPREEFWKHTWKYQGPKRVRFFPLVGIQAEAPYELEMYMARDWIHQFLPYMLAYGAVARDMGNASAGGMLRDQLGNWILGFNQYLGKCSPSEAEALTDIKLEDSNITLLRRLHRTMRF